MQAHKAKEISPPHFVGWVFEYKCWNGHVTERMFPFGTFLEKHDVTVCAKCLIEKQPVVAAYLVFMRAVGTR
jgi:hypothetical protein